MSERIYLHTSHEKEGSVDVTLTSLVEANPAESTLHPTIIECLDKHLVAIPHLSIVWPRDITVAEDKWSSLQSIRNDIASVVGEITDPRDVMFWIAKTLSVTTRDGGQALVTDIVHGDSKVSDTQKRWIISTLQKPELLHERSIDFYEYAAAKVSRKQINGMRFSDSSFDLASLGLAPGVVGPWAIQEIPRIILPNFIDEKHDRTHMATFVDYAISTRVSILIPNMLNAYHLPSFVSASLGQSHPLYVYSPEL